MKLSIKIFLLFLFVWCIAPIFSASLNEVAQTIAKHENTVSRKDVDKWLAYKFEKKYPNISAYISRADNGQIMAVVKDGSILLVKANPDATAGFIDILAQLKEIGISQFS